MFILYIHLLMGYKVFDVHPLTVLFHPFTYFPTIVWLTEYVTPYSNTAFGFRIVFYVYKRNLIIVTICLDKFQYVDIVKKAFSPVLYPKTIIYSTTRFYPFPGGGKLFQSGLLQIRQIIGFPVFAKSQKETLNIVILVGLYGMTKYHCWYYDLFNHIFHNQ